MRITIFNGNPSEEAGGFDTYLERLTILGRLAITFMFKPFTASFWNSQLKKHGAFERRFDRPYES